jgi:hypothetical protein
MVVDIEVSVKLCVEPLELAVGARESQRAGRILHFYLLGAGNRNGRAVAAPPIKGGAGELCALTPAIHCLHIFLRHILLSELLACVFVVLSF